MLKTKSKFFNNFLNSNKTFSATQYKLMGKYHLANILLLAFTFTLFLLAFLHSFFEHDIYIYTSLIAGLVSFITLILLRYISTKFFYIFAHIFFIFFFILLFTVFFLKPLIFPITTWFLIYIMAIFFIFKQNIVFRYFVAFMFVYIMLVLNKQILHEESHLTNFVIPAMLGYFFIYFYELRTEDVLDRLKLINIDLEDRINIETKARTEVLENEKEHLIYLTHHDYLTGLPNIAMIDKAIENLIDADENKSFALLYLDLDGFKKVNDNFGHRHGNNVIKIIAYRLANLTSDNNIVARIGGDEFLIIISDSKDLNKTVEEYILEVEKDIKYNGITVSLSCSIGVSKYPMHSVVKSDLIVYADKAMMKAKKSKNHNYYIYSQDINDLGYDKSLLEVDMSTALKNEEFLLYYQPQIDANTEKIVGIEALVRWEHPTLGILEPHYFLDIAKNTGLILNLEYWIIKHSMLMATKWHTKTNYKGRISINLTIQKLEDKKFINDVKFLLFETKCKGSWIEFEITETEIMSNMTRSVQIFNELKQMNITISIDDFGTGYSSLSYLRQLSVDKIKIDKIFVDDLLTKKSNLIIIDAILAIAKSFNYDVVTEGVESLEQVECLKMHGCNIIQGYYFHKPMKNSDILKLLAH